MRYGPLRRLDVGSVPDLIDALENWDDDIRFAAIDAIERIGVPAVPDLMGALRAENGRVRVGAVYALARIGPDAGEAIPVLRDALAADNEAVREGALIALLHVTASLEDADDGFLSDMAGVAVNTAKRALIPCPSAFPLDVAGAEGSTVEEVSSELRGGGRFLRFRFCISTVVVTFICKSKIHFIAPSESVFRRRLPYALLSFLLGWWSFYGPIVTIGVLATKYTQKDVTEELVRSLNEGLLPHAGKDVLVRFLREVGEDLESAEELQAYLGHSTAGGAGV